MRYVSYNNFIYICKMECLSVCSLHTPKPIDRSELHFAYCSHIVLHIVVQVNATEARAKDETIAFGATVCEKWINATQKLTELFWPHHSLHPWRGPIFVPGRCSKLGKRLR